VTTYRIRATKEGSRLELERANVLDAFRALVRLRELGWKVTVSR
jgi:hypothetical protein